MSYKYHESGARAEASDRCRLGLDLRTRKHTDTRAAHMHVTTRTHTCTLRNTHNTHLACKRRRTLLRQQLTAANHMQRPTSARRKGRACAAQALLRVRVAWANRTRGAPLGCSGDGGVEGRGAGGDDGRHGRGGGEGRGRGGGGGRGQGGVRHACAAAAAPGGAGRRACRLALRKRVCVCACMLVCVRVCLRVCSHEQVHASELSCICKQACPVPPRPHTPWYSSSPSMTCCRHTCPDTAACIHTHTRAQTCG